MFNYLGKQRLYLIPNAIDCYLIKKKEEDAHQYDGMRNKQYSKNNEECNDKDAS